MITVLELEEAKLMQPCCAHAKAYLAKNMIFMKTMLNQKYFQPIVHSKKAAQLHRIKEDAAHWEELNDLD